MLPLVITIQRVSGGVRRYAFAASPVTHATLKDDHRYERVFLGRWFARAYLGAMGQPNRSKPGRRS